MLSCAECGSGRVSRYSRGLRVDPRGVEFAERVPAVLCADCGRIFATDAAIDGGARYGATRIERASDGSEQDARAWLAVLSDARDRVPAPVRASGPRRALVRRVVSSLLGSGGF